MNNVVVAALLLIGLVQIINGSVSIVDATQRFENCVFKEICKSSFFSEEDISDLRNINNRMKKTQNATSKEAVLEVSYFVESLRAVINIRRLSEKMGRRKDTYSALELCSPALIMSFDLELVDDIIKVFLLMKTEKSQYVDSNNNPKSKNTIPLEQSVEDSPKSRTKRAVPFFFAEEDFDPVQRQQNLFQTQLSNLLSNSLTFTNAFVPYLPRQAAVNYATQMAEAGVVFYGNIIINEAADNVANSLRNMGMFATSNDYASIIAKSVANVLKRHELLLFANGNDVGTMMISKLQNILDNEKPVVSDVPDTIWKAPISSFEQSERLLSDGDSFGSFDSGVVSDAPSWKPVQPDNSFKAVGSTSNGFAQSPALSDSNIYQRDTISGIKSLPTASEVFKEPYQMPLPSDTFFRSDNFKPKTPLSSFGLPLLQSNNQPFGSSFDQISPLNIGKSNIPFQAPVQPSTVLDFQPSPVLPQFDSSNNKEAFQNQLALLLSDSDQVASVFCNGPSFGVYNMISSALMDYGFQSSTTAASEIENIFSNYSPNVACDQYAKIISDVVANVFIRNGLLNNANAYNIANMMIANVGKSPNNPIFLADNPEIPQQKFNESISDVQLQPSFPLGQSLGDYALPQNPPFEDLSSVSVQIPLLDVPNRLLLPSSTEFVQPHPNVSPFIIEQSSPAEIPMDYPLRPEVYQINPSKVENEDYKVFIAPSVLNTEPPIVGTDFGAISMSQITQISDADQVLSSSQDILSGAEVTDESTDFAIQQSETTFTTVSSSEVSEGSSFLSTKTTLEEPEFVSSLSDMLPTTIEPTPASDVGDLVDAVGDEKKLSKMILSDITSTLRELNKPSVPDEQDDKKKPNPQGDKNESTPMKESFSPSDSLQDAVEDIHSPDNNSKTSESPVEEEEDISLFLNILLSITSSSMTYIKSDNYNLQGLCSKLNALASVVDILPLDNCSEIVLVDYLLHILKEVVLIFKNA